MKLSVAISCGKRIFIMKPRYVIVFLLGIIVGLLTTIGILNYKIARYNASKSTPEVSIRIDPGDLITIRTPEDIETIRANLIDYIWQGEGFPLSFPHTIEKNYSTLRFPGSRIDLIKINMKYGLQSNAYLFHPATWNQRLILYHEGHDGDVTIGKKTIDFFVENHYQVLAFSMPLIGMNNQPVVEIANIGPMKISTHDQLKFLDRPISYFLEPVAIGLNYVIQQYQPELIAMTGISGGGWTTTLYSAIDPRVTYSYPVAGSLPIGLRSPGGGDWGDWEQTDPGLYAIANYYDLYILGAANGRQMQILNQFDPCCFGGERGKSYEQAVDEIASRMGGNS
jgi:hypothetical protein